MTQRHFLDANILFTATISPDGASRGLTHLAAAGVCVSVTSSFALDEVRRNLRVKYPGFQKTLDGLMQQVTLVPEADKTRVTWAEQLLPPKDAPILAAAIAADTDALVTGDRRHFGALYRTTVHGVLVLPPRDALERILTG